MAEPKVNNNSKINSFMSTFDKGVARPNLFTVMMNPPTGISRQWNQAEMELRVQSVTMPGKNITTTPNDNAYGPSYEMANGISYAEEISVTYILDSDHRARELFNAWQDMIVDPSTYDLNYYKDYIGKMTVYQLDQNDGVASAVEIQEVYPKSVGPIEFSMESGSSFQTVTVNMAFKRWVPILATDFNIVVAPTWIGGNNDSVNVKRPALLDALYKISSTFGIGLPPGVKSAMDQITFVNNFSNDPMSFGKQVLSQTLGKKLGGFLSGFGT
mgnify:FL=1|tara:strand:- start:8 stop:820 length:813 start_codon:yes stop_codon:yes gene_type:complete